MTRWPVEPLTFSKKKPSRAIPRSTYIHPPSLAKIGQRTSEEIGNKQTDRQTDKQTNAARFIVWLSSFALHTEQHRKWQLPERFNKAIHHSFQPGNKSTNKLIKTTLRKEIRCDTFKINLWYSVQFYDLTGLTLTLPGPSAGVSGSLDSYCSLKPLCSGMGEVVPARTSPTLLPPSPRTVLSLSCFKVSQWINCRDWHCKS